MKKFKFRLEKVLQFRRIVQDEKKRELNIAMRLLREKEQDVENLEKAFLANRIQEGKVISIEELSLKGAYAERLKNEIAQGRLDIMSLQDRVEEARKEYIEATKEVEVLEKLKEKKHEQYQEMIAHHEQKVLDELVTQRKQKRATTI